MMFVISILVSFLLGWSVFQYFFYNTSGVNYRFLINISIPMGMGFSSFLFILLDILWFPLWLIFSVQVVISMYLFYAFYRKKTTNPLKPIYQNRLFGLNELFSTPVLLLAIMLYSYSWLMDAGIFFIETVIGPHGLWDAWSCWNLISRFIARAPHDWPSLLHQMNAIDFHPDYPLLQRGFIAFCWRLIGIENTWIPAIFSFIIAFCTIGLVSSAVTIFTKNKLSGLIAGLVLLATPFYMLMGFSQYADNTVGYFFLATIVLITMAKRETETDYRLLFAAGVTAGLAAWSKNEGLVFILMLFISQFIRVLFTKNFKGLLREFKYLLLGMLPFLLIVAYQKFIIAPTNQIVAAQGANTLVKLTDTDRYALALSWFKYEFVIFGDWYINPWWFFLAGIIFKGGISIKENNYSFISNCTLLILMVTAYFFVEIITPLGLFYYLSTSVHRLFFQLFPSFIFIYFLAINGEAATKQEQRVNNFFKKYFKRK